MPSVGPPPTLSAGGPPIPTAAAAKPERWFFARHPHGGAVGRGPVGLRVLGGPRPEPRARGQRGPPVLAHPPPVQSAKVHYPLVSAASSSGPLQLARPVINVP